MCILVIIQRYEIAFNPQESFHRLLFIDLCARHDDSNATYFGTDYRTRRRSGGIKAFPAFGGLGLDIVDHPAL